jgi:hypothetical protein
VLRFFSKEMGKKEVKLVEWFSLHEKEMKAASCRSAPYWKRDRGGGGREKRLLHNSFLIGSIVQKRQQQMRDLCAGGDPYIPQPGSIVAHRAEV